MPNESGKLTDRDEVTFNVKCTMPRGWIPAFMSMLKYMEECGRIGHSSVIGMACQGCGDYRPKFTGEGEASTVSEYVCPCIDDYFDDHVVFGEATPDSIEFWLNDGKWALRPEQVEKVKKMKKEGWSHKPMKGKTFDK